jgi:large repetitive protein
MRSFTLLMVIVIGLMAGPAGAVPTIVDGTSNTILIGETLPPPNQGTIPPWIGGSLITPGNSLFLIGDGSVRFLNTTYGPEGGNTGGLSDPAKGLSGIYAPWNSLLGVFTGDTLDPNATPATLDFLTPASRSFTRLQPDLQQRFFIGDGTSNTIQLQEFAVPQGATRLYYGVMDSGTWGNEGWFNVDAQPAPVPPSLMLFGSGLLGLAGWRRFRKS